jgi:hypothetical protein
MSARYSGGLARRVLRAIKARRASPPLYVLFLLAPPAAAQVEVRSHAEPSAVRLSQFVTVRLTVDGPAPLRVEVPDPPLAPESANGWRVRPLGPAAVTAAGDRETWERAYRLDPFDVPLNRPATVTFAPVVVNGKPEAWPPAKVTVSSVITDARPEAAHSVTGIEDAPPKPPPDGAEAGWVVLAVLGGVFFAVLVLGLVRKRWAKPPPLPPAEWALAELDRAGDLAGRPLADRVAEVLRLFVEATCRLPAPRLTTAELAAATDEAGWAAEPRAELRELLERCDRAKFAGAEPDPAEGRELTGRARRWVDEFRLATFPAGRTLHKS